VGRNLRNRDKERSLKEQVPKRSYGSSFRQGRDEDALILSDELDIDVASEFPGLQVEDENVQAREEEEIVEHKLGTFGKAKDPILIYLKEMGSLPLLTREGEVEIAKRIESGKRDVLSVVLNCPIGIREVINLGGLLRAGKIEIREVTNEVGDEETDVEKEKLQKKRVLNLINKIQRGEERIRILQGGVRSKNKEVLKKKIREQILKKQIKIFDTFKRINLREKQINRIVQKLKQRDIQMEKAVGEVRKYEEDLGISVQEARKSLKVIKKKVSKRKSFSTAEVRIKLKDWKEMIRIARNVKRKVGRMEVECGLSSDQIKEAVKAIEKGETKAKEAGHYTSHYRSSPDHSHPCPYERDHQ